MFDRLTHADWSMSEQKRWSATAECHGNCWKIESPPSKLGCSSTFLDEAFRHGDRKGVLLGFDFPIGLPEAYCKRADLPRFKDALSTLGTGRWNEFFDVASKPDEVSLWRPFYPESYEKGVTRGTLLKKLGADKFDDLLRICERRTKDKRAACCLFWTLGANQVGKAAISGWRDVIIPAVKRGARLWPFDGTLAELAKTPGVVIAETYPADAYGVVRAAFKPGESKRRLEDRKSKAKPILSWATRHGVAFSGEVKAALLNGFERSLGSDDAFDAFVGLLLMIEVAESGRPEPTESHPNIAWEGWILRR
jgi:hypothetical protein